MRADDSDRSAPAPNAGARPADKLFLGPEFVTWLYFHLQEEGFAIALPDVTRGRTREGDEEVRFAIGKRSTLKMLDGAGLRVALSGPGLDDSGELLQAIRRGAFIDVLALQMQIGERVYEFSLHADASIGGLKLPDLLTPGGESEGDDLDFDEEGPARSRRADLADHVSLRMMCLDEVEAVVDALYARFVTRRLARAWSTEDLRSIRRAVAARLAARLA